MCGILCAYSLGRKGIDCVIAQGNRIASGITKNTTAKITSQHGIIYADLIKQYGLEKAKLYLDANQITLAEYESNLSLGNKPDSDIPIYRLRQISMHIWIKRASRKVRISLQMY
ncbi:MAG: hypothetical protein IJQ50_02065 [Clostridia bacterium]|nr:hypothetical protein [Clostridia bacterium]